ncbi:MAG: N-acyl-D-amino acid deacylase, partial [Bacteroidota bacterium]
MPSAKIFFFLLLVSLSCQTQPETLPDPLDPIRAISPQFSLLIEDAYIIDGSGQAGYSTDLLIRSDTIAFIGAVDTNGLIISRIIPANGRVLSPGFIDPHSHGDPLREQDFANFIHQGVTSITLGQDGFSPKIEDWEKWMDRIDTRGIRPNLAMMIGHGSMRERSGVGFMARPRAEDFLKMQKMLVEALQAGAFGMSTGLEYTPGLYAGEQELAALAKTVGQFDGIIMSHIRNEDDDQLFVSLRELMRQGQHCRVQVSHIKSVYGKGRAR